MARSFAAFPAWACTALSADASFPLTAGLFDLVLLDEASQCSLAAILPLAYRARRLAVVGDPRQLRPITLAGAQLVQRIAAEAGLDDRKLRERGLHHKDGSAFSAFGAAPGAVTHLLAEHYRSHPRIARWFNERFYGGKLEVLTATPDGDRAAAAVRWHDAEGESRRPAAGGGWENEPQAAAAAEAVARAAAAGMSVAAVTPYAAQAALVARLATEAAGPDVLRAADFVCGTAHRLQGAERDAVVFATSLTPLMPPRAAGWIERERNLVNVAVSRARRMLICIGHPAVGKAGSPTLASLREWALSAGGGTADGGSSAAPPADAAAAAAAKALRAAGLDPAGGIEHEGLPIGLALQSGNARLAVEIGRAGERRHARDLALAAMGWSVARVPAWRWIAEPAAAAADVADELRALSDGGAPRAVRL